jgi:hypothetical protein
MIMENLPTAKYEREILPEVACLRHIHPPDIKFFQNVVSCGTGGRMMTMDVLLWMKNTRKNLLIFISEG